MRGQIFFRGLFAKINLSPVFEAPSLSCFVELMGTLRFAHPVIRKSSNQMRLFYEYLGRTCLGHFFMMKKILMTQTSALEISLLFFDKSNPEDR